MSGNSGDVFSRAYVAVEGSFSAGFSPSLHRGAAFRGGLQEVQTSFHINRIPAMSFGAAVGGIRDQVRVFSAAPSPHHTHRENARNTYTSMDVPAGEPPTGITERRRHRRWDR